MDWDKPKQLFKRYLQADEAAIDELFLFLEKYIKKSLRSHSIAPQIQDEITQTILLKIHAYRDRYDINRSLRPWVVTIIKRTLIDYWRTDKSPLHHKDEEIVSELQDQSPVSYTHLTLPTIYSV